MRKVRCSEFFKLLPCCSEFSKLLLCQGACSCFAV